MGHRLMLLPVSDQRLVSAETHSWSKYRELVTIEKAVINGKPRSPPPRTRECRRRARKNLGAGGREGSIEC